MRRSWAALRREKSSGSNDGDAPAGDSDGPLAEEEADAEGDDESLK